MASISKNIEELIARGRELMVKQQYKSAINIFEEVADRSSGSKFNKELGYCHLGLENFEQAILFLNEAVKVETESAQLFTNLGVALFQIDDIEAALSALQTAANLDPNYSLATFNMGNVLLSVGRVQDSLPWLSRSVEQSPEHLKAHLRLGDAFKQLHNYDQAEYHLKRAISIDPADVEPVLRLADLKTALGELHEAKTIYTSILEHDPSCAIALANLGYILCVKGHWEVGLAQVRKACRLDPSITAFSSQLLWLMTAHPSLTPMELFSHHRAIAEEWEANAANEIEAIPTNKNGGCIRIGYLSAAFNHHVCMDFFLPLLTNHSKADFEIFCYSASAKSDDITETVRSNADSWRDLSQLSDSEGAAVIQKDGLNILVDLDGHATGNRIGILCHSPAPVIVSWLGYPNTTGLKFVDYRLVDDVTDPVGEADKIVSEKLVRLPNCFLTFNPIDDIPVSTTPPIELNGHCTFACFNHPAKINDDVLALWARLIGKSEGNVLVLKNRLFTCKHMQSETIRKFESAGIEADRIIFYSYKDAQLDHLHDYTKVDIALDPFPYNGTTTTCEALWMGVPVITKIGDRHASRVGASLLKTIGAQELVANFDNEYINIAHSLSKDRRKIATYRMTLREKMQASPLCDYATFARSMEDAYKRCIG